MSARKKSFRRKSAQPPCTVEAPVLEGVDASLLDIVDHVLTKGIVLTGDVVLGVADVDLVYLRLSAVLCAADRVLGKPREGSASSSRRAEGAGGTSRRSLVARKLGSALGKKR